jgi:hypothetical protein
VIKLALDRVLLASLIETEDLVAQVQPIRHEAEPFVEPVAAPDIVLRVGIDVLVAIRSLQAQHRIVGRGSVYPKIRIDAANRNDPVALFQTSVLPLPDTTRQTGKAHTPQERDVCAHPRKSCPLKGYS